MLRGSMELPSPRLYINQMYPSHSLISDLVSQVLVGYTPILQYYLHYLLKPRESTAGAFLDLGLLNHESGL
jgi:hypothetical protein